MNATDIVGYAYEADIHCTACAEVRFPQGLDKHHEDPDCATDSEGNPVTPVFCGEDAYDEEGNVLHCGDCNEPLFE